MTTFKEVRKTCAVCGKEGTYRVLRSTMSSGYPDLDTRSPMLARMTLPFRIHFCKNCHYANYDIALTCDGFQKEWLQHPDYLEVVDDQHINFFAKAFLLSGYLYANAKDYEQAGMQCLRAAWVFDDIQELEYAKQARRKALQYLTIAAEETEDVDLAIICVDLQRRTGDFSGAIETAQKIIDRGVEDFPAKILEYGKKLCQNRDSDCHNAKEATLQ